MKTSSTAALVVLALAVAAGPLRAGDREHRTVESATDAAAGLAAEPLRCIPPALMEDAAGVALIPHVVKAGFVLDGRFGRGVVLARRPDGTWSNPIFLSLAGGGVGWQAGVESTDVILVFKTRESLRRLMEGKDKITLGADAAVAAGPLGRQAEAATDAQLKAEIYSYSRSRGLFIGASLEGAGLLIDRRANEDFYGVRDGRPADVLALPASEAEEVFRLKDRLMELAGTPPAPPPAPRRWQPVLIRAASRSRRRRVSVPAANTVDIAASVRQGRGRARIGVAVQRDI